MTKEYDKKEVYGVDDAIVNNGLSLERFKCGNSENLSIRKLALNGEFIPGQCAWKIGERNKWGCREVIVHFEVYDGDNNETNSGQLVNLK